MESTEGNLIYFSIISNQSQQALYTYNGGDHTLQTLAAVCLQNTPPFHSHYFHTSGHRTFGYLIDPSLTYFAIIERNTAASTSSTKFLKVLQKIKNAFLGDQLVVVLKELITSLESMGKENVRDDVKIDVAEEKSGDREVQVDKRKLWRRHVKIVVALDVFLCLVLFGMWLAVCKGFECVSRDR